MWLKVHHTTYFMASVLSSLMGEKIEKIVPYLNECRVLGIGVLPPDVNQSSDKFEVSKDRKGIHFGLKGISGVGEKATANILDIKERHQIRNLVDFITLTSSSENKTVVRAIIQCGAIDFLGYNRRTLLSAMGDILELVKKAKQKITNNKKVKKPKADISVFWEPVYDYEIQVVEEFSLQELCNMERTLTGFYMTHHPLDGIIKYIRNKSTHSSFTINHGVPRGYVTEEVEDIYGEIQDVIKYDENGDPIEHIEKLPVGQTVITGGVVKAVNLITIRNGQNKGKEMASFILEDAYQGDIKCTIFNKGYERHKGVIKEGNILFIQGKMDYYRESAQILVDTLSPINRDSAKAERQRELLTEMSTTNSDIELAEETIGMFIEDVEQISNVCDYLEELYDKLDEIKLQLEEEMVV
jgi:DNA polymerase-3 subunit alpha